MRLFTDLCYWVQIKDGDERAMKLFNRHYSKYQYRDGRRTKLFVGPGEKIVLLGQNDDALFVWRKFKSMDNQTGVNCSVFRNESKILSSDLIIQAEPVAARRWGNVRLYTYVNAYKIKSINPGCCFKKCGWTVFGISKSRKLIILEKILSAQ